MRATLTVIGLAVGLAVIPSSVSAAGNAQAHLANDSIHVYPGDCSCGFGLTWRIHFSTVFTEAPAVANGEVAPLPQPAAYTHWSFLLLEDPSTVASPTYAELNLPLGADENGNGTPDLFEAAQGIAAVSQGTYAVIWGPGYGLLTLEWSRAAGSRAGTCRLRMVDPILGEMGPFTHPFELVSYTGALSYTPGSNMVTGTLSFFNGGQPADSLAGPVSLVKVPTNRFNLLTLSGGQWTNGAGVFTFGDSELRRDAAHPALYRAALQNPDGPYRHWQLSLVDTNDANGNGIPDLSDDVAGGTAPRRPVLALSLAGSQLWLRVAGDVGHTHVIQRALAPDATNWTTVQSLTLTNDPQVTTLPRPAGPAAFWRVQAQ